MSPDQAFFSQRRRGKGGGRKFTSIRRGFKWGRRYYQQGNNFFSQKHNSSNVITVTIDQKISCQICWKFNHKACRKRFDHSYQSEDIPTAFAAMKMHEDIDPTLYADSGATSHILNYPGNISSTTPYNGQSDYMLEMVLHCTFHTLQKHLYIQKQAS